MRRLNFLDDEPWDEVEDDTRLSTAHAAVQPDGFVSEWSGHSRRTGR